MSGGADSRGQTLHDFAIGMTIFLLVIGYVFAFVPSLFTPFTPETDSTSVRVDRTADLLTRDALAENASAAGLLNSTCTGEFFATTDPSAYCRFEKSNIQTIAALPARTNVNVTMRHNGGIATHPTTGTVLARGPSAEEAGGRVIRAVRIVTLLGSDYQFVVRLW